MDFLLDALAEIASEVFASVAHLLNLDLDIVFVDTTSTLCRRRHNVDYADLSVMPMFGASSLVVV